VCFINKVILKSILHYFLYDTVYKIKNYIVYARYNFFNKRCELNIHIELILMYKFEKLLNSVQMLGFLTVAIGNFFGRFYAFDDNRS